MTPHQSLLYQATRAAARTILPVGFQVQIEGLHHLPETGPAILIPKHQRWWDVPLLGTFIPRPLYFLAKQELFANSCSRFYMNCLGGISLDRKNPLKSLETFRSLLPLLKGKSFLVLFPEGTYFPGTMGPGKWRLIQMILNLQVKRTLPPLPFIPVGIGYSSKTKSRKRRVEITVGPALTETSPLRAEVFTCELLHQVRILSRL
jgi:1-acyl-sn-glycerol-3-phosphate acyltransferase